MLKFSILAMAVVVVMAAGGVLAQGTNPGPETPAPEQPAPVQPAPEHPAAVPEKAPEPARPTRPARKEFDESLSEDAVKHPTVQKYGYRETTVFPQSLFDGEHLRPYERRGDDKQFALLGSWSLDARAAFMIGSGSGSRDGMDLHGRVRFGFVGADLKFTHLDDSDGNGPTPQTLEDILSLRLTFDLDFTEQFTMRPLIGWASLDHDNDTFDDDVVTFGSEFELSPMRPLTIEASLVGFHSPAANTTFWDGYFGIGIYPLTISDEPPTFWPSLRVGIRRIAGPHQHVGTTMFVIDVGIGF